MIVDTNVLVRVMQGHERATRKLAELEGQSVRLTLLAVSLFELYHSVEQVHNPVERRRQIEAVLDSKPTYPADDAVMKKAGRIDGRLTADDRAIGMSDTVIGAALVHEGPVLTENVDHFERIDGLEIESY